jgi:hypothetical protein
MRNGPMGETVMESNPDAKGWLEQHVTLPNLILFGGLIGAGFVWHYRTEQLESRVIVFEQKYVPREINDLRFANLLEKLDEINKKLDTLSDEKNQRGRRP